MLKHRLIITKNTFERIASMKINAVLIAIIVKVISFPALSIDPDGWTEYKTQNFSVYSNNDEQQVLNILREFEVFRTVVLEDLNINSSNEWAPARIFLFSTENEFRAVNPRQLGGYYIDSIYGPTMVVGPNYKGQINIETLYHEYVHYLMRSGSGFKYPTWYDEGIAEYYSSMDIDSNRVLIGKKSGDRELTIDKAFIDGLDDIMRIKSTFEIKSKFRRWNFYKASWIAVNFFNLGSKNGFDDYRPNLINYLNFRNKGSSHDLAFEQTFNVPIDKIKQEIRKFAARQSISLAQIPTPKIEFKHSKRAVSIAEMSNQFSILLQVANKQEESKSMHDAAMLLNDPLALAYNAYKVGKKGNIEDTVEQVQKVLSIDNIPANAYVFIGQAYLNLAKENPNLANIMQHQALPHFEQAKSLGAGPQLNYFYTDLLWALGKKQQAIDTILALAKKMPSNIQTNFKAGDYMIRIKNIAGANYFLGNVINWSSDEKIVEDAKALLNTMNNAD